MRISGYQATNTAIQNPFTFYYVNNNDWSSSHSYQFWNKNFTTAVGVNNDATLKTIYSSSPTGFVEPKTAAFTGFTSTGGNTNNVSQFNVSGSFNKGWIFYTNGWKSGLTIYFCALGLRDAQGGNSGMLDCVHSSGKFQSVGAYSYDYCRLLWFNPDYMYTHDTNARSSGLNIYPVKE